MAEADDLVRLDEPAGAAEAMHTCEEAMRAAVHSTDPSSGWPGLSGAADVYAVLGALGYTFELLPQLLEQLTGWLDAHAAGLQVENADAVPDERLAAFHRNLDAALPALGQSRDRLARAQAALAPVSGPVDDGAATPAADRP
jgi:hypothetical protein